MITVHIPHYPLTCQAEALSRLSELRLLALRRRLWLYQTPRALAYTLPLIDALLRAEG